MSYVYMERAAFMTYTTASHHGVVKLLGLHMGSTPCPVYKNDSKVTYCKMAEDGLVKFNVRIKKSGNLLECTVICFSCINVHLNNKASE